MFTAVTYGEVVCMLLLLLLLYSFDIFWMRCFRAFRAMVCVTVEG